MIATDFRKSPEFVAAWRALLTTNPIVAQVLVVLKDEKPSAAVPYGCDGLDRAAALARLEQHEADYNLLLSLAEAYQEPAQQDDEMTYGVDKSKFQAPPKP